MPNIHTLLHLMELCAFTKNQPYSLRGEIWDGVKSALDDYPGYLAKCKQSGAVPQDSIAYLTNVLHDQLEEVLQSDDAQISIPV